MALTAKASVCRVHSNQHTTLYGTLILLSHKAGTCRNQEVEEDFKEQAENMCEGEHSSIH